MTYYIENLIHSTKTELTSKFSKVAGYKRNVQNVLCFYILINYQKEKLRNPFIIVSKGIRYLGINLTKNTENYKVLRKEIEDITKKWKDIPYSWIGITNLGWLVLALWKMLLIF